MIASDEVCRHCEGTGEIARYPMDKTMPCGFCAGSGLKKEPKFRAVCECGAKQPRATTAWTVNQWMREHLKTRRSKANTDA